MSDQVKEIPTKRFTIEEVQKMNELLRKSEENTDKEKREEFKEGFKKYYSRNTGKK